MNSDIFNCTLEILNHTHENILKFESCCVKGDGYVFIAEYCNVSRKQKEKL